MIAYIDAFRERFGVETICEQLPIAPFTYYATKSRPPSDRAVRDEGLKPERSWSKYSGDEGSCAQRRRAGSDADRVTFPQIFPE